jgi:hypothetical protein
LLDAHPLSAPEVPKPFYIVFCLPQLKVLELVLAEVFYPEALDYYKSKDVSPLNEKLGAWKLAIDFLSSFTAPSLTSAGMFPP